MDNLKQLHDFLAAQGFSFGAQQRQMNDCNWYAWRRINKDVRECDCNAGRLQLVITPNLFSLFSHEHASVEVDITGEAGGIWWKLMAYSIKPDELMARLDEIEAGLVNAWQALK